MALTFERSFLQAISGRYNQSTLGYGWVSNWDISASTDSIGNGIIENQGTTLYYFKEADGSYQSEAGDHSVLTLTNGAYRLVTSTDTTYQFNPNGTLQYVEDANGNRITAGYNAGGQLASLTDSNGEWIDLSYNAQGLLSRLTDSTGLATTYTYNVTPVLEFYGFSTGGQSLTSVTSSSGTTSYAYVEGQTTAQNNALSEITYANNTHLYFSYDSEGRLVDQHADGGAENEKYTYGAAGGYTITDGDGNASTVLFTRYGAVGETIDSVGNVTRYLYDSNLDLVEVEGPLGTQYRYTYDTYGNLASETDPLGQTTQFTYGANNNLTSYTDPNGNTTSYAYDGSNDLMSIKYANGTEQGYSYNPLGEATQFINANGDAIGYTYNAQGLVETETFSDGTSYSYTYDARGDLTSATDAQNNSTTFFYDDPSDPDLLTEVLDPDGTYLKFTYNVVGQRTQSVDQTGFTVNYTYDGVGRLEELTDGNGDLIVQYTYDAAGQLVQKDMGNGTRTIYTYDNDGNVLSIVNLAPGHVTINSYDDYTYDALGDVLTDTSQDGEWTYAYDADSQLIHAVFVSANLAILADQNLQYVYDAAGNRTSETVNGVVTTYITNTVNEYTSSTTNGATTSYQYDADGNLILENGPDGTTNYTFNELNELTAVNGQGLAATYGYDALGDRVSQVINGLTTRFQIDRTGLGNVVATFDANDTITAHYTYGVGLVSQVTATGIAAYYDFNSIGSTTGITDMDGTYTDRYGYMPFGQTITVAASSSNPFTFVGQFGVLDSGIGIFLMHVRNYDSSDGQFLSDDPIGIVGGQTNTRVYVGGDPISWTDPSGLRSTSQAASIANCEYPNSWLERQVASRARLNVPGRGGPPVAT